MTEQRLEEGAFKGWEEDFPEGIVEEVPEGVS